jgi:hypothetical protein
VIHENIPKLSFLGHRRLWLGRLGHRNWRQPMTLHRYRIGQQVELLRSTQRSSALGPYSIVSLVPIEGDGPKYRLKGDNERHERIVCERDLTEMAIEA